MVKMTGSIEAFQEEQKKFYLDLIVEGGKKIQENFSNAFEFNLDLPICPIVSESVGGHIDFGMLEGAGI